MTTLKKTSGSELLSALAATNAGRPAPSPWAWP